MVNTGPQPHIIYRLTLSKSLFKTGIKLCKTNVDIFSFSQGIISLHDALDNFAGAISTHLSLNLTGKDTFLIQTLDKIEKNQKQSNPSFTLTSRNEIVQLNTIRNNIKHQGITPNIRQNKALIGPIVTFFQEYSRKIFSLDWDLISLADLIKKESVKNDLKDVEKLIDNGNYKEALNKMAIIKFQVFDESQMQTYLDPEWDFDPPSEEKIKLRNSANIFPHQTDTGWFSDLYNRANFLEKGIDREALKQFEDLTAKVGINNPKEWEYILEHSHYWGELNWTKETCIFCYDFLVDIILKHQGKDKSVYPKWLFENHIIRVKKDMEFYDKDDNLIYTLKKGEEREVMALGWTDGKWEIFDQSDRVLKIYPREGEKEDTLVFFKEGEESNIEFIKTDQFTQNEDRKSIFIKEITY